MVTRVEELFQDTLAQATEEEVEQTDAWPKQKQLA